MENRTVYERVEGETTQWEDLQRKFGNLPPKEPVQKADPFSPAEEPRWDRAWLEQAEAPEDVEDAEDDFADDRFLEQYRWAPGQGPAQFPPVACACVAHADARTSRSWPCFLS